MKVRSVKKGTKKRLHVLLAVLLFLILPRAAPVYPAAEPARVLLGAEPNTLYIEISVDDHSIVQPPEEYHYRGEGDVLVQIKDFNFSDSPGNPALPYRILKVALPPGADRTSLKLEVIHFEEERLTGSIGIAPVPPYLFDQGGRENNRQPPGSEEWGFGKNIVEGRNTLVYNKDQLYPGQYAGLVSSGQLRKWNIASISLYPVRYNPVQRKAVRAKRIIAKLSFNTLPHAQGQPMARKILKDDTLDGHAKKILLNYNQAKEWYDRPLYTNPNIARDERPAPNERQSPIADYVIITTVETLEKSGALLSFCVHKENLGHSVMVVTEESVYTVSESGGNLVSRGGGGYEYVEEGVLRQQKIKKWLSDHYVDLGIKYVLLIGDPNPGISYSDNNKISVPMLASWPKADEEVPTDLYYADLAPGNWDLDNDGRFGEWVWHDASGALPDGIDENCFSVRWEGYLDVPDPNNTGAAQNIAFDIIADGKLEVWVDGNLIANFNIQDEQAPPIRPCVTNNPGAGCVPPLTPGRHPLRIEYRQSSGDAHFMLYYVDGAALKHRTDQGEYIDGLKAKYFDNDAFAENDKTVERIDGIDELRKIGFYGDRGPDGVDFYSELFVGRIPFYNVGDVAQIEVLDSILTKIIQYENHGPNDAPWRFNVLSITPDMYSSGADYKGCETLKTHVAPEPLWHWYRIHEQDYGVGADVMSTCRVNFNDSACFERTVNAWKEGRGVVMWRTHGSTTGASRVFHKNYCAELDDGKPSIVLMITCGNGWPEVKSLGYSLLERGAVATISASRVTRGGRFNPDQAGTNFSKKNSNILYYLGKAVFENVNLGEALAHVRSMESGSLDVAHSHWWTEWNNALAYNLYGDPSLSLFGKGVKSNNDIVLLLDGSGSMLREGKWEKAKNASVLLYDLLKALRHPTFQDRYNGIVFRCQGDTDASSAFFPGGMLDLSDNPLTIQSLNPFTPESRFYTPMGSGLEAAVGKLDMQSPMSFYSNKIIVLLSDGKHNCGTNPLDVNIPDGVKIYAIGLGEDDIEPETIENIATSTGAAFKITPSPREMEELFIQVAAETSWKLQDVPVENSGAAVSQDKVAFVVVWDNPEDNISFELDLPGDGPNLTPNNLDAFSPMECVYYEKAPHTTHAFYVCDKIPPELLGEWKFTNIKNGTEDVDPGDVLMKVIEDPRVIAEFGIERIDHYTGQPMVLSARLTGDGKPLTGVPLVYADLVRSPAFPLGTLLSENSPSSGHPSAPPANSDRTPRSHYIDGIMKELKIDRLSKPVDFRVEFKDDGLGIDRRAGDGIYTGVFTGTEYEGSYTFKFRARGQNSEGVTFDRTQTLSKYVKFAANPGNTAIEVVAVDAGEESEYFYATIRITPKDKFGAYMGPFRGDRIRVWSDTGGFDTRYNDGKDGSYDFSLGYAAGTEPRISVSIGDVMAADRVEVPLNVPSPRSFSLYGGFTVPTGAFNTNYKRGYSFGLKLDYHFTPQFSVEWLVLGYHHFKSRTSSLSGTYWCNISSNLKYEFSTQRLRPYINGGPGIYTPKKGTIRPGFNVGLGLNYSLIPDWIIEFGGDYHHIFRSRSDTTFFVLHTGLIHRF